MDLDKILCPGAVKVVGATFRPKGRRPCLVITQGTAVAEHLLDAAARRRPRLVGALSTGTANPGVWARLALAASRLDPVPLLLIALHQPVKVALLARLANSGLDALLLLMAEGRKLIAWPATEMVPAPDAAELARAMGLTVADTPAQMMEAAYLLEQGVPSQAPRVLALASSTQDAALLTSASEGAGLRLDRRLAALAQKGIKGARRKGDVAIMPAKVPGRPLQRILKKRPVSCLLSSPLIEPPEGQPEIPWLTLCTTSAKQKHEGDTITLAALSALQRTRPVRSQVPQRRPGIFPERMQRLLDGWREDLHELQIKQVLAGYGLQSPAEDLASSSSAASRVARQIGFPVAIKAVGPQLRQRRSHQAMVLGVETEAGVRQAFRDVLHACSQQDPPPLLEGVLISAMHPHPSSLDCVLLWMDHAPPLLLVAVQIGRHYRTPYHTLACPLDRDRAREAALALGRAGFHAAGGAFRTRQLSSFLLRLSWAGPDLAGRMRFLRLDTVAPPGEDGSPPLVIDGYGQQTESFRAPLF